MAREEELEIFQGADFGMEIHLGDSNDEPIDITEMIVRGGVKRTYSSEETISFGITYKDAENGIVIVSLPNEITQAMKKGRYVYDLELVKYVDSVSIIEKLLRGTITVNSGFS